MNTHSDFFWLFFRFSGRIGRSLFGLGSALVILVPLFPFYRLMLLDPANSLAQGWAGIFLLLFVVSLWCQVALCAKRLHDLGKPGLWSISIFIPVVSIVLFVALCMYKGDPAPNLFGRRTDAPD